jgi:plastocyanin
VIRRSISAGLVLVVAVVLAACGGTVSQAPTEPSQGTAQVCVSAAADADFAGAVTIENFSMSPTTVSIKVNETVAWTNQDAATHTATLESGDCSTDSLSQGAIGKLTFSVAGTYDYKCRIHPGQMNGFTVEVTP